MTWLILATSISFVAANVVIAIALTPIVLEMLKNFPHAEFVTAFYGADVSQSCATELLEDAQKLLPDAEIVMFPGGQPLYDFIISVE